MEAGTRGGHRLIAAAAVAGLVIRLAFGLLYWNDKPLTHDEREYLALAQSLAAGQGLTYGPSYQSGSSHRFGRPPVYPLLLATIGADRGDYTATPARVKVTQACLGAIGVYLIGLIALRVMGRRASTIAAAVAAIYPPFVWMTAYVLTETLYSTLALTAAWLLDAAVISGPARRSRSTAGALLSGVSAGIAVLVRPVMLFFFPFALIWLVRRRDARAAMALLVASLAVVLPWTLRNYRVYGRFIPVASEGGVNFWIGNHPLARGEGDMAANPAIKEADLAFRTAHPGLSPEELEPLYYRDALRQIAAHPLWWLSLVARKAFYLVVPIGPSYTLHSMRYLLLSVASYLLLLAAAVAGVRPFARLSEWPVALLLMALSTVVVSLLFFPQERFRIPTVDPALILIASAKLGGGSELS